VLGLFAALRWFAGHIVTLLSLAALSTAAFAASPSLPQFDRVRILDTPVSVPQASLTDQDGEPFALDEMRGRVALLFFGFTNCPDVCPMAMQNLRRLEKSSDFAPDEVAYVLISVDGERDTPAVMKAFLAKYSPAFIGLTADPAAVKPVAARLRASFFKGAPDGHRHGYDVAHSPQVFVVDSVGRLRAEFYNASNEAMQAVISALIEEAAVP
jgi:protein SCO1/2